MYRKIKQIKFLNIETNKIMSVSFSKNNNIIIGPKGGGKSTLLNILAASILNNSNENKISIPEETKIKLEKYSLKINNISFYNNEEFTESQIDYSKSNYSDSKDKNKYGSKENKELQELITWSKQLILQEDDIKNNFFKFIKDDFKKKYIKLIAEDGEDQNWHLGNIFSCFANISEKISELSKICFHTLKPDWSKIKYFSVNMDDWETNNKTEKNILSKYNANEVDDFRKKKINPLKDGINDLRNHIEIEKLEKILKNDISSKIIKNKSIIEEKINSFKKINDDIIKLVSDIPKKMNFLDRIVDKFNLSFTHMESIIKNKMNDKQRDEHERNEYINKSEWWFKNFAELMFNIKWNILEYKKNLSQFKPKSIVFNKFLDNSVRQEYSFWESSDIMLDLNIKNSKEELEKFMLEKILNFNKRPVNLSIKNFLLRDKKGQYELKFKNYQSIQKSNIQKSFIETYSDNVFFSVKEIRTSTFKPYDLLSSGEKSIYGIIFSINRFSDQTILIDQPEDNLDNETISTYIINKLKKRSNNDLQTFIVTHNANIGILSNDLDTDHYVIIADIHNEEKYFHIENAWNKKDINEQAINYLEGSKTNLKERHDKLLGKIEENKES